jgi:fatty acid desaturase
MRRDHEWLEVAVPIAVFAAWLFAIAWATVAFGVWGFLAAWIGIPIAGIAALYASNEIQHKRAVEWHDRELARRRHPAGSAGEYRSWG